MEEKKNYFLIDGIKVHWNFKLLPKGFEAITLFGHVFDVRKKESLKIYLKTNGGKVMVNHEKIHMLQAESFKLRYFTFYVIYLWYWIVGLFKYNFNSDSSYYNIPFEKEAYTNEENFSYSETHWREYV